jgi:hypothetical protein
VALVVDTLYGYAWAQEAMAGFFTDDVQITVETPSADDTSGQLSGVPSTQYLKGKLIVSANQPASGESGLLPVRFDSSYALLLPRGTVVAPNAEVVVSGNTYEVTVVPPLEVNPVCTVIGLEWLR